MFATRALRLCLGMLDITTVLDVGCGRDLQHAQAFERAGKKVLCWDPWIEPPAMVGNMDWLDGGLMYIDGRAPGGVDLLWSSHTLEHVHDVQEELEGWTRACRIGGVLAITVPPWKSQIVGGHVNGFNAGLLLYRLVLAGVNCAEAMVISHDYNVSVVVRNQPFAVPWEALKHDRGDLEILAPYFPTQCRGQGFDGNIAKLNWPD